MKVRWQITLLLLISTLVYTNSLFNGFAMDDHLYIQRNPQVTKPSLSGLFRPNPISNVYRPVTFATLALNWSIAGNKPFAYHLVNLLLNAAVVVLLFFVLRSLFAGAPGSEFLPFAAALLFAVHPIHTEAVSSVVGRSELLAAGFLLAAWLFHLQDRYVVAILSFVLALLSKESAIVLLPLAMAGDYARGKLKSWARYGGIAAFSLVYLGLLWKIEGGRFGAASVSVMDNPLVLLPANLRILNALRIAWRYVGLLIFPKTLSCDYSYNQIPLFADAHHLLFPSIAALALVGAWLWTVWRRKTGFLIAGAVFFAGFAVTSNIVTKTGTIFGERLAYFPSVGFCLLVALGLGLLSAYGRRLAIGVLVVIVTVLAARTVVRNRDWHDNATLYMAAADAVPNSAKMRTYRGLIYLDQKQLDGARADFEAALAIDPDFPNAVEAMGMLEARAGNGTAALSWLRRAVEISDRSDFDYDYRAASLASLEIQLGRLDDAMRLLNREIAQSPGYSPYWSNRAALWLKIGRTAEARSDALAALRLDPANAQAAGVLNANFKVQQP